MKNIPGRMSSAQNQYLFQVSIPPLGFTTYYFQATSTTIKKPKPITTVNEDCILQNNVKTKKKQSILSII